MTMKSVLPVKYEQEEKENHLTSFGGIPVFIEFLKGIGFDRIVSSRFMAKSAQGFHPLHHILTVTLINLTGGQSVSDVYNLEADWGLKRFFRKMEHKFNGLGKRVFRKGRTRTFPSPSRIFGFLDRFNSEYEEQERQSVPKGESKILPVSKEFSKLVEVNREVVSVAQNLNPQRTATLDMDNNLIVSQKSTSKVSYKKTPSYQPFNVYWYEQDLMLLSEFRDGNVPAGKEQLRLFKQAEAFLPEGIEVLKLRSDSAGYQHEFLEYMESGDSRFGKIRFAISCDVTQPFRQAVLSVKEDEWQPVIYTDENGDRYETIETEDQTIQAGQNLVHPVRRRVVAQQHLGGAISHQIRPHCPIDRPQTDREIQPRFPENVKQSRKHGNGQGMLSGDGNSMPCLLFALDIAPQFENARHELLNFWHELNGVGKKLHRVAAAVDQWNIKPLFELLNSSGEGRLRHVATLGALGETPAVCERQKILEPLQFHLNTLLILKLCRKV